MVPVFLCNILTMCFNKPFFADFQHFLLCFGQHRRSGLLTQELQTGRGDGGRRRSSSLGFSLWAVSGAEWC